VSQIETGDVLEASRARVAELEAQLLEAERERYVDPEHRFTLWKDRAWETEQDLRKLRVELQTERGDYDPPGRRPPPLGALP
jgi:hypothetical protein